jgi:transposase-like protein
VGGPFAFTDIALREPIGAAGDRARQRLRGRATCQASHVLHRRQAAHILQAADLCTRPGEIGALMHREGVYSSLLSTWRRQREAADLAALTPQRRGPKVDAAARVDALHIAQLTRESDKLRVELDKAQLVIEVQRKLPALLGLLAADDKRGNT